MASGVTNSGGASIKYSTPPLIVHSQPDFDARCEASHLRCQDNHAHLPYFLEVTHESDWKQIFCGSGWPLPYAWPHKDNANYSKLVIYHIAAQNHMDVSSHASKFVAEGRFGAPGDVGAVWNAVSNPRVGDVFTPEEVAHYSEAFLFKVFHWLYLCFEKQNPPSGLAPVPSAQPNVPKMIMSKSTTNSPKLKPIKHRKSKSHSMSIEVPPNVNTHLLAVPPSADLSSSAPPPVVSQAFDPRRVSSEQIAIPPKPSIRGGDRTVSGSALDVPSGPKTGPMMGQRLYVPLTPPVGHMRPPHPLRNSTSQNSTPQVYPQAIAITRRDVSNGLHSAHIGQQFPPQAVRTPSGDLMRHTHAQQMPGHIFTHPAMPSHPGHHVVMGPPPPPMSMSSPGVPMSSMHPVYYDPSMVPQGARHMVGQKAMLYGADAHQMRQYNNHAGQSPYTLPRQLGQGPGRFSGVQTQDMGRPPPRPAHQSYGGNGDNMRGGRGRKSSGRGRGRGGMPSYDGGRKNSLPHRMDRPFHGGILDSMPPGPPPVEHHLPYSRRESFSMRENVRPSQLLHETERFPDFHESEMVVNPNLPPEQQCSRKFIGSDVEGMDSLWIGNIAPGVSDHMLRALIEEHVPVKNFKPILYGEHGERSVGWTITTFHKTSDVRVVLEKLELKYFNGLELDVQVPERFRNDLSERDIQRRLSSNKQVLQGRPQGESMPAGQIPLGPRSSFGRNNSIRRLRTNSLAHSDGSGRRNSMFSPQDARSDLLPGVPEITEAANLSQYPPIAETPEASLVKEDAKALNGSVIGTQARIVETIMSGREEEPTVAPSDISVSSAMHPTAAPFVPPKYNSFDTEISGPTNKHLVIEEEFHRSASSESLRRTSQGYDYEFAYIPTADSGPEKAIEDDSATNSDASRLVKSKKSKGKSNRRKSKAQAQYAKDVIVESDKDVPEDDGPRVEQGADMFPAAEVTEAIQELSVHLNEGATTHSTKGLPVPAIEPIVESCADSVQSEAPTEILSASATEDVDDMAASEPTSRKAAVPAGSIHPFAKAKTTCSQRQISKAEKKKAKKQGQAATKKKTDSIASFASDQSEPEILSLDQIKAKAKSKAAPSKLAPVAPELQLTKANIEALAAPVIESTSPVLESGAPLLEAEESIIAPIATKAESVTSVKQEAEAEIPGPVNRKARKTLPAIALPLPPVKMKRTPSVTINPSRKERKSSTVSMASDSSMGTPKTAKEFQTPVPSPSPSPFMELEETASTQATAGAPAEAETPEVDSSCPPIQTKKPKKKKPKSKKKKNHSVDAGNKQEEGSESQPQDEAAHTGWRCTGMDQDSSPSAQAKPELQDDNKEPGNSSTMTGKKENVALRKPSWAQMAAGKSPTTANFPSGKEGGLTARNLNAGQFAKGG